tara:strand:- start:87 stop:2363 length:2277 start_codon:yes stop_codon:yes gene_type:complete
MKVIQFCNIHKIPYIKINVSIKNGKKEMVGIKSGWTKWNYEECLEKNKDLWFEANALNVNLNKSKFMVIDLDDKQYQNEYMNKYGGEFQSFSTRLKMPHLWRLKSNNDLNTTKIKFKAGLDLLYHNTFEDINGDILNTKGDLKTFLDFPEVKKINKKISASSTDSGFEELKPSKPTAKQTKKISEEQIELLDNISLTYLDNYSDWLKIIWSLNNEFNDFKLIKKYSMKSKKYCGDEKLKKYLDDDKKKLCSFGTIDYYSKLSNRKIYFEIKAKYTPIFFSNSDYELADLYLKSSCDNVLKQDDELYFFEDNFWTIDHKYNKIKKHMRDTLFKIFTDKRELLNKLSYSEENEKKIKNITSSIKYINTSAKQKAIIEQISVILQNKDYNFDCNRRELFCFKNTAYNLESNKFENINKFDYITLNCGYDWREPTEDEVSKINKFLEDIQPNTESKESVKSILRRGLYGQQDEYFVLFNGRGGNGKGVLMELFKASLNEYFYEGSNGVLTEKVKKSGANQEVANCDKKRLILYSEPDEGVKLNGSTIKYMTGNPVVNARALYSQKTKIYIHALQIMECNQRPAINGRVDASFFRRLIDILFPTQFVNSESEIINENYKLKDESFKKDDFKENHKFALIKILMEAKPKIYIPKSVKDRSEQYLLSNDEIYTFVKENFEMTDCETDVVTMKDMYNCYKQSEQYQLLSHEEKREMNSKKFKDLISSNPTFFYHHRKKIQGKDYRSIVSNIRYKENIENESENEDE